MRKILRKKFNLYYINLIKICLTNYKTQSKKKMSSSYASPSKPIYWIKSTMPSQWSDIFLLGAFKFHETVVVVEWAAGSCQCKIHAVSA